MMQTAAESSGSGRLYGNQALAPTSLKSSKTFHRAAILVCGEASQTQNQDSKYSSEIWNSVESRETKKQTIKQIQHSVEVEIFFMKR